MDYIYHTSDPYQDNEPTTTKFFTLYLAEVGDSRLEVRAGPSRITDLTSQEWDAVNEWLESEGFEGTPEWRQVNSLRGKCRVNGITYRNDPDELGDNFTANYADDRDNVKLDSSLTFPEMVEVAEKARTEAAAYHTNNVLSYQYGGDDPYGWLLENVDGIESWSTGACIRHVQDAIQFAFDYQLPDWVELVYEGRFEQFKADSDFETALRYVLSVWQARRAETDPFYGFAL